MTENCTTAKVPPPPSAVTAPQRQPSSAVLPGTPDATSDIVYFTGFAAAERRNNRTLMNCFRDRTPAYGRSTSRLNVNSIGAIAESAGSGSSGSGSAGQTNRAMQPLPPQATRHMRAKTPTAAPTTTTTITTGTVQLKPRVRTNMLTLLKSASARDLRQCIEQQAAMEDGISLLTDQSTTSTLNSHRSVSTTSSSGSSGKTMNPPIGRHRREGAASTHLSAAAPAHRACESRSRQLEQRLAALEALLQQQNEHASAMEVRVVELTRQLEELTVSVAERAAGPRKKSSRKAGNVNVGSNVQPSKLAVWMNLSNLWKSRPSIETLKEKNIYNDEPCFDTEIQLVLKHEAHKTVPKIIVDCCELIEEKYRKSPVPIEGLYRQCGDYNHIQTLRFKIDANDYVALRQHNVDLHVLTGLLKLFLREIKQPLISANEAKTFIGKPNQWHLTALNLKIDTLKRLIISLPEVNRDTASYLFTHFNRITKVPLQHVSAETLAISVTPSIFHTVPKDVHMQDIHTLLKESEMLADCVKIMIDYHSRIFGCIAEEWRRSHSISLRRLKKTLSHPDLIFHNLF